MTAPITLFRINRSRMVNSNKKTTQLKQAMNSLRFLFFFKCYNKSTKSILYKNHKRTLQFTFEIARYKNNRSIFPTRIFHFFFSLQSSLNNNHHRLTDCHFEKYLKTHECMKRNLPIVIQLTFEYNYLKILF